MMKDYERARPFCDWIEDYGDVLWWRIPVVEGPYLGSPLCCGFPVQVTTELTSTYRQTEPAERTFNMLVGGWPFSEEDERHLWWTPISDGKTIEDQVPL